MNNQNQTQPSSLIEEWQKRDPFLLDLESFQQFCDVRNAGGLYPLNVEDIFYTIEPIRREVHGCANEMRGNCMPQETNEAYWERNRIAAETIKAVIALVAKKSSDDWPEHLGTRHLDWVEAEFGVAITEDDFKDAWELWERKYWFSGENGYYVQGWLALADALNIGAKARELLEMTPFPHADSPKVDNDSICHKVNVCPIYQFREWLKTTHIEDIPDLVFRYTTFRSNVTYHIHDLEGKDSKQKYLERINDPSIDFRVKWNILRMIKDYQTLPPCKKCGELSYTSWKIDSSLHEKEMEEWEGLELCWNCQLKVQKAYETKVMPLKFQNKEGRHFGLLPPNAERELRRKLIEGDKMFDDITTDEQ